MTTDTSKSKIGAGVGGTYPMTKSTKLKPTGITKAEWPKVVGALQDLAKGDRRGVMSGNRQNYDVWEEESLEVAYAMTQYGGSFIRCLGQALYHADNVNVLLIREAWPEEWDKYLQMARYPRYRPPPSIDAAMSKARKAADE